MGLPVYPFRAVLRELRREAGLSILAAGDATGYGKYERWESGETSVGARRSGSGVHSCRSRPPPPPSR